MAIKPSETWRWYFDAQADRIMLDLDDGTLFRSRFSADMLLPEALNPRSFTEKQVEFYYQIFDSAQLAGLQSHHASELALNAIVAKSFLKPLITKSWYFLPKFATLSPAVGDVVEVTLSGGSNQGAHFMVIDTNNHASLCLLLDAKLVISGKPLHFSQVLKIMNDRLSPCHVASSGDDSAGVN